MDFINHNMPFGTTRTQLKEDNLVEVRGKAPQSKYNMFLWDILLIFCRCRLVRFLLTDMPLNN